MSKEISREERIEILKAQGRIQQQIDYRYQRSKCDKIKGFAYKNPSIYGYLSISQGQKKSLLCWCAQAGKIESFITQDIFLPCEGNKNLEKIKTFIFTDDEYRFEEEPIGFSSNHVQKALYYRNEKLYEGYPAEIFGFESMVYFPGKEACCIFVKAGTGEFEENPLSLLSIDLVCWVCPDIFEEGGFNNVFPPQNPFDARFCGAKFYLGDMENAWPLQEANTIAYNIRGDEYMIKKILNPEI